MKKILLVTRNFPPLTGGMERLNKHIYLELNDYFNVSVVGPRGCRAFLAHSTLCYESPHKPLSAFLLHSFWSAMRLAIITKPDIIIAGSGITALSVRIIGYLCNAKVVSFLHGLDIIAQHPVYQHIFLPAIRRCDAIWVNSANTKKLAISKGILPEKIKIIHPGVSIPDSITYNHNEKNNFLYDFNIKSDRIILLSVGRLTDRKGLVEFIHYCLPDIVKSQPKTVLLIIGDNPTNALHHKSDIKTKIQSLIKQKNLEDHVKFLGHVSEQHLHTAYRISHLHIFPIMEQPGDIEGFGMVAIEAAAYGLATIAFNVGGVPDAVADNISGLLIQPGDYAEFSRSVIDFIKYSSAHDYQFNGISRESCILHANQFSWKYFGEKIRRNCSLI